MVIFVYFNEKSQSYCSILFISWKMTSTDLLVYCLHRKCVVYLAMRNYNVRTNGVNVNEMFSVNLRIITMEALDSQKVVYIITYSQAGTEKFGRETFEEAVTEAWNRPYL